MAKFSKKRSKRPRRTRNRNDAPEERQLKEDDDSIEVEGTVVEQLRNAHFRVELDNGMKVMAYTGGKMRKFRIRIMPGDRVVVALSPYDLERGRIVYRQR